VCIIDFSRQHHRKVDSRNYIGRKTKPKFCSANKKLKSSSARTLSSLDYLEVDFEGYRIFYMRLLFTFLENNLMCKCGDGNYSITCDKCLHEKNFHNTKKIGKKSNIFEINRRSVLTMRLVGGGLESLRTFSGVMDFLPPIQNATFTKIRNVLFEIISRVADKFMSEAVDEELRLTRTNSQNEICEPESVNPEAISQLSIEDLDENMLNNKSDVTNTPYEIVACKREIGIQGTWQRRSHRSCNGFFFVTAYNATSMKKFMDQKQFLREYIY
ncbi:hypothetical protein TSAR_006865, partial [Trichomalopsis sarcophagae]